jgi:protein pelota
MTLVTHRISVPIPRKASAPGTSQYEKAMARFYATLYDAFVRHIPYTSPSLRAIVLASPGWVREGVFNAMMTEAGRRGDKTLSKALREKTVKVHVSSAHVHSLVEVLKSPEVGFCVGLCRRGALIALVDRCTAQGNEICARGNSS